ncbi:MAG: threonine synthase [Candidatus Abyssubacteria bacterium]
MTTKYSLKCPVCSTVYPAKDSVFRCEKCSAPTVVSINLDRPLNPSNVSSMWRYLDLLPIEDSASVLSQGEGGTPLRESPALAKHLGVSRVLLKNETVNPTGSFKDRQISLGISKAREAGAHTIAVVSSGNVAASAASYSAVAGMRCNIFAPANAPEEKLVQARAYGAAFYRVNTLSSSRIFELVVAACRNKGWYLLSTAGLYNPYQVEGAKTIAYELVEHLNPLPDWIIAPVGGGGLLGALWRGFNEMKTLGKCREIPGLIGVQSSACTPLVNAIKMSLSPAEVVAHPVSVGHTIAGAIADDILFDAFTVIPAIRETGGAAIAVTDDEMLEAEKLLARTSGIFAEPASAATVAAVRKLRASGAIGPKDSVCCIITGSGFKDMTSARKLVEAPRDIEPSKEAFLDLH